MDNEIDDEFRASCWYYYPGLFTARVVFSRQRYNDNYCTYLEIKSEDGGSLPCASHQDLSKEEAIEDFSKRCLSLLARKR